MGLCVAYGDCGIDELRSDPQLHKNGRDIDYHSELEERRPAAQTLPTIPVVV
jgi:hypothetical protein